MITCYNPDHLTPNHFKPSITHMCGLYHKHSFMQKIMENSSQTDEKLLWSMQEVRLRCYFFFVVEFFRWFVVGNKTDYEYEWSAIINIKYVNVWKCFVFFSSKMFFWNEIYLRLRSGDAQRTAMLGIGGTRRIAIITWFFQRRDNESRWLSDGVFFGGAELRNNEARLSLTGLIFYCCHNYKINFD